MAMPMGVLLNILVLCTVVAKLSCAELAILSSLESPEFKQGRAIDALGEVVFVAGSGVTAVNVSKHHDLEVADTLHDTALQNCEAIYAYASTWGHNRLAVACADSLVILDAQVPANLQIVGAITAPDMLGGAMSVVVKDQLAFVASSRLDRVVSISLLDETKPEVLSYLQLSSATSVALLHEENKLLVGSGGRASRVTIISYAPSGVFMKVGSVKDSRLSGPISRVHDVPNSELSIALSSAQGGTFVMLNTSAGIRPNIKYALHSEGRYNSDVADGRATSWSPNGHKELGAAAGLCIARNGLAYVAASNVGAVCGVDMSSEGFRPNIVRVLFNQHLEGVVDICVSEGEAMSRMLMLRNDRTTMHTQSVKFYALNPRLGSIIVLIDSDETNIVNNVVLSNSKWEF